MKHISSNLAIIFVLLAIAKATLAQQEPALHFDIIQGDVIACIHGQILWTRNAIDESTRAKVAPTFQTRFFVQNLKHEDSRPHEVWSVKDSKQSYLGTVFSDDSIAVVHRQFMTWTSSRGQSRDDELKIVGERVSILAIYPDGVVVQPTRVGGIRNRLAPLWWIPIKDGQLKIDAKISLLGEDEWTIGPTLRFVRFKQKIGWLDCTRMSKWLDEKEKRPPALFVFDISGAAVTKVVPRGPTLPGQGARLSAFDADYAFDGSHLITVKDGTTIETAFMRSIGIRNGEILTISETLDSLELRAIPLTDTRQAKSLCIIKKSDLTPDETMRQRGSIDPDNVFLVDDEVIRVWNGKRWNVVEEQLK